MRRFITLLGMVVVVAWLASGPVGAQKGEKIKKHPYAGIATPEDAVKGPTIKYDHPLPTVNAATSTNWTLHNLDLSGTRYSTLDQINTSNVKSLAPRWLYQTGAIVGSCFQTTPIVVDGVMYVTDATANVFAIDALTGDPIWKFTVDNFIGGGERGLANRGVTYGDGKLYVAAGPSLFAIDARTGEGVESFGPGGENRVAAKAIQDKYPDNEPIELGYAFTMAPQYHNGVVFIGTSVSESHIPGGLFLAVDGTNGNILWKFNTIPQGPEEEGWEIAKDTWVGGARNGGGIWETPAIDPELGMIYLMVSNTSPDFDGSARKGINLFTNSVVALDISTGKIRWYFQQVHHDLWDYDSVSPTILFDVQVGGKTIKAVAQAQKNGYVYIFNRETGEPVHPIVEVPVPTATDIPGDEPWPTQPIPFTVFGRVQESAMPVFPIDVAPEAAQFVSTWCSPGSISKPIIHAPGAGGGPNFAPPAYSPRTGLLYVTAIDSPSMRTVVPQGNSRVAGSPEFNYGSLPPGRGATGYVSAYDPATGAQVWQTKVPRIVQGGVVATAGDLLFVGDYSGYLRALDARTGQELWKFNTGAFIAASPIVYEINGETFVSIASGGGLLEFPGRAGNLIATFALPK